MKPRLHFEQNATPRAPIDEVFAYLDDHKRLSAHMGRSSWMMGGGRMSIELDEHRGQRVGSRVCLAGRAFGMRLFVEETVVERDPPRRKVWQTVGAPRLLVIGEYRMGFELAPEGGAARLRVFIDYALPQAGLTRWLGMAFGRGYAKWCTRSMLDDAVAHFASLPSGPGLHNTHRGAAQ
jgi:hypothetical protein